MSEPIPVKRRALFGYARAAGVGAAAGLVGGRVSIGSQTGPHGLPVGGGVSRQRYDAHGVHQSGILTPAPTVHRLLALNLRASTDADGLARLMRVWSATIAALMGAAQHPVMQPPTSLRRPSR